MLPIPHQNGIVHQTELIRLSVKAFADLAIIGDVSEELPIPVIRQIIVIPSEQNLLTFKLRDQCDECFVSTPHGHIPKNINGIAVGDLGVPMLNDILVHFSHGGERSPVIVHTLTRLIPVEEMEVSNEVECGFVGLTGIPSYSQYERVLEELDSIGVKRINVMVDSDYQVKEEVRKARDRYIEMGAAAGFEMAPITWTQKQKGVDDLYKHLFRDK